MSECNIKLRHEGKGKSYPRTCAKCKLGPRQDGQDYAGLTARIRELEAQLAKARAEGWRRGIEAAAEVCTIIMRDYDVMKPDGKTYEPVRVQRIARGLVAVAREDIRAIPMPADLGVRHE